MDATRAVILIIAIILVAGAVAAYVIRARKRASSPRGEALRQRLRHITLYDEAKANRLVDFERTELKRKGLPDESLESLMGRAIERWERDNASAAPLY